MKQIVLQTFLGLFIFSGTSAWCQNKRVGDFSYYLTNDTAVVFTYDGPSGTNVVVPSLIEGLPVVDVQDAFKYSEVLGVSLPTNLNKIGDASFFQATLLTNLVIPPGVTQIGYFAFSGCVNLAGVEFSSDQLSSLGSSAFLGCRLLRSIRIPTNVTSLSSSLLNGCSSLTNVILKGNLIGEISVGPLVFAETAALKNLVFEGEVKTINTWVNNAGFLGAFPNSGLTNLVFKKNVGEISSQSFINARQLKTVIFEGDVQSLGAKIFQGCDQLENIYFLGDLENVGAEAFAGLKQVRTLVLPPGLKKLGERAFENCTALREVIFLGAVAPQNDAAIFRGCSPLLKVKYPQGAPGWAAYPNYGNRPTEPTPTVAVISNLPEASSIRLGQSLAKSRLSLGKANLSGKFEFVDTNTVPPAGLSQQPIIFRPDLWFVDEILTNVPVQVWTNIPLITVPTTLAASVGRTLVYAVEATDGPSTFSASGLPEGFSLNAATGEIRGVASAAGTFAVEISARNASAPPGFAQLTLNINRGIPGIAAAPAATPLRSGQPLSASRLLGGTAANDLGRVPGKFAWLVPDRKPAAGNLPQAVRFTPADSKNHQPTIFTVPVTVLGITSDLSVLTLTNRVAQAVPYVLQANVPGARFRATGLPPGLRIHPQSGVLSGRPARAGTYPATFFAQPLRGERFSAAKTFVVIPRTAQTYVDQALSFLNFRPGNP